ncbi:MAG: hypothetical protein H6732_18920 [Alphaproteobacteria bacterium]|nr:hypothetical protein [Alphaproteobacteria bacterium]
MRARGAALASLLALPSLLAGGCGGVIEDEFIVDWEVGFCDLYASCASDEMIRSVGVRECHAFLRSQAYPEPPDCTYDGVAAAACLVDLALAVDEQTCNGVDPALPASCTSDGTSSPIYSGCRVPRLAPVSRASLTAE